MTVSTHVYTAVVLGTPDVALKIKGGSITLDDTRAPHVQSTLTIAIPNQATLDLLDPRNGKRVRVDVAATFPSGAQARSFNLGIRDRRVQHLSAEVELTLASDEAILADYAPLVDDITPLSLGASLRSVVNYVLGKALPGTALAATPSNDADVSAYWPLMNELPNPGGEVDASKWTAAVNCTIFSQGTGVFAGSKAIGILSSGAGGLSFFAMPPGNGQSVRPGQLKTFRVAYKSNASSRTIQLFLRWVDSQGNILADAAGAVVPISDNAWHDGLYLTATAPPGAAYVVPWVTITGSPGAGHGYYIDQAALYTGPYFTGYLDGSTPAGGGYTYGWSGPAGASTSTRTPIVERPPAALIWSAGTSALDFLLPLFQAAGFRLVCDEARTWTLRAADYAAAGTITIRHGVNLIDGTDSISRDEGLWFDAQVTRYTWDDVDGITQTRVDAYALTATPSRVNLVEIAAPYPGPGRSKYAVERAQGQGRTVTATAVSDWRARAEQPSEFYLVGAPTQLGKTSRVTFDLDSDRMTITSRTTDTPPSAWLLIPTGQKWTDSPAGGSWTGETI